MFQVFVKPSHCGPQRDRAGLVARERDVNLYHGRQLIQEGRTVHRLGPNEGLALVLALLTLSPGVES